MRSTPSALAPTCQGRCGRCGQAGVDSVHGVTVRVLQGDDMGVAEKNLERAFFGSHFFEPRRARGLFFEFKKADVFQVHGTTCGALG